MTDVMNLDLYELLGVAYDADEIAIKKAYRKKALFCHPDKNPDDPNAEHLFHQLSQARDILLDSDTRRSYDLQRISASISSKNNNDTIKSNFERLQQHFRHSYR